MSVLKDELFDPAELPEAVAAKDKLDRQQQQPKPEQLAFDCHHNEKLKRPKWLGFGIEHLWQE
jgi:hypothetical protein